MFIFNNSGFTYGLKYRDFNNVMHRYKLKYTNGVIEVPYNRNVLEVPDDVDTSQFDRNILQVFPSKEIPSLKTINKQMNEEVIVDENTIDIDLDDIECDKVRYIKTPIEELEDDIRENGIEIRAGKDKMSHTTLSIEDYVKYKRGELDVTKDKETNETIEVVNECPVVDVEQVEEPEVDKPKRTRGRPAKRRAIRVVKVK